MIRTIKLYLLLFVSVLLTSCASISMQSQMAPNIELTKNDALYLETPFNAPIGRQKYIRELQDILNEQGFNLVENRESAKYIMMVNFNDFSAPLTQTVPDTKTTIHNGQIGTVTITGSSTTIGSKKVHRKILTHNSHITVNDRISRQPIWEVSMAKSYDVYNHPDLKKMIEKMISLYGTDEQTTLIISDSMR